MPPSGIIHPDGKLFILLCQYNLIPPGFRPVSIFDEVRGILSSILSIILLFQCCNTCSVTFRSSSRDNVRFEIRIHDFTLGEDGSIKLFPRTNRISSHLSQFYKCYLLPSFHACSKIDITRRIDTKVLIRLHVRRLVKTCQKPRLKRFYPSCGFFCHR